MKTCTRCGETKQECDFQIRKASKDGLTASCKKCLSAYDKSRANDEKRVKARLLYSKTESGKAARTKANRKFRANNPKKYLAHNMVNNAIRDGKMKREACEVCGRKAHAHHDDYSFPLTVRWLCAYHHAQWHRDHGEALNPF